LGRSDVTTPYVGPGRADRVKAKVARAGGGLLFSWVITDQGEMLEWGPFAQYPGPVPTLVTGMSNIGSVSVTSHACVVADGHLDCWGGGLLSAPGVGLALCSGLADPIVSPLEIRTLGTSRPQQVSVSDLGTCVRMIDGTVQCCGSDDRGQLGTGEMDAGATA